MCSAPKPKAPPPPAVPAPPPPPPVLKDAGTDPAMAKKPGSGRGVSTLRIDRTASSLGAGRGSTGLQIGGS